MRYIYLFILFLPFCMQAQDCNLTKYRQAMTKADSLIAAGKYVAANDQYNAAKVYCRDSTNKVQGKQDELLESMVRLRQEADSQRRVAEAEKLRAEQAAEYAQAQGLVFQLEGQSHKSDRFAAFYVEQWLQLEEKGADIPPSLQRALTEYLYDLIDGGVREFNLKGFEFKHTDKVEAVSLSPDGSHFLTRSTDNTIRLWGPGIALLLDSHQGKVNTTTFSPDGSKILSSSSDSTAKLWDIKGNLLVDFDGHTGKVWSASFSPDGNYILTCSSDHSAKIWKLDGSLYADLNQHKNDVIFGGFSPDGKRVLTTSALDIYLWSSHDGSLLRKLNEDNTKARWIHSGAFSPDGSKIVTVGEYDFVRIFDQSGEPIKDIYGMMPLSVSFSQDGEQLLIASAGVIERFDLEGNIIGTIDSDNEIFNSAAFSSDGSQILTASDDRRAKLWNTNGDLLADLSKHSAEVNSAIFSPDNKWIYTASNDSTVRIWPTPKHCVEWILSEFDPKPLTEEERIKYNLLEED